MLITYKHGHRGLSATTLIKPSLYLGIAVLTISVIIPSIISLQDFQEPTGTFLNPLPETQLSDTTNQQTSPTVKPPLQSLVDSSKGYLQIARELSASTGTREDIIKNLNSALQLANEAVSLYPLISDSYILRAEVLLSSTNVKEDANQLAQQDLKTAELVTQNQIIDEPNIIPLFATPDSSPVIIASANEQNKTSFNTDTDSNASKIKAIFPKNSTEMIITDKSINESSYIYLVPETKANLYIKTKQQGKATIALTEESSNNINFEYWVVNP